MTLHVVFVCHLVSSMCSQETAPITFQACVMTKDCVLSEWSEWAACSKDCYDPNGPKGQRTRSRRVSQFPVGGGTPCPQLEETEPCSPQGDGMSPCIMYVHNGRQFWHFRGQKCDGITATNLAPDLRVHLTWGCTWPQGIPVLRVYLTSGCTWPQGAPDL